MASKILAKRATEILYKLLIESRALSVQPFDSPNRERWRDNARGVLERADVSISWLDHFNSGQAFSVGSKTTDEELRAMANSNLAVMTAALQSAIDQLGWENESGGTQLQAEPRTILLRLSEHPRPVVVHGPVPLMHSLFFSFRRRWSCSCHGLRRAPLASHHSSIFPVGCRRRSKQFGHLLPLVLRVSV